MWFTVRALEGSISVNWVRGWLAWFGRNLVRMAAISLVGSIVIFLVGGLSTEGWSTALRDALGWGLYFSFFLWFVMLPGTLTYLTVVGLWTRVHGVHARLVAVVLSPLLAVLPAYAFTIDGTEDRRYVFAWTFCVAVGCGVSVRLPERNSRADGHFEPNPFA